MPVPALPEEPTAERTAADPAQSTALVPTAETSEVSPLRSRRGFLGFAAAGVASAGGAGLLFTRPRDSDPEAVDAAEAIPTTTTTPLIASEDVAGRTLVVVELSGGNDGLATLVPRNSGVLYDRRPSVHVPDEELIDFTDEYGLNPNLEQLSAHGLAAFVGLGTLADPDGSHFEMERRWWAGSSSDRDLPATGFLGRLCDQLVVDQPVTGLAVGAGANPSLLADKAVTMGLADPGSAWFLHNEDPWLRNLHRGFGGMAINGLDDTPAMTHAREGLSDTLAFAQSLGELDMERVNERYPNTNLGWQFGLAAELINQDAGVRVLHLSHGGFDTHSDQRGSHDYLLMELSEAMGTFLEDIGELGHGDSTLVCTTSEFGRRVPDNDRGTDHGAAGMAFLAGPVVAGIHGESPSLTALDDDNLIATTDFEQYYATIAEKWFGIASSEVLTSGARPVEGVIT